ncbi:DUF5133 domain-containing protein [Phaeacidiphilus oryzae]|uniref:DUF5133 domain-containing protein n=1 Tax=Phaeacidiphilus oryzae TaxID=348818 RepID=UPI000568A03B|nr:DUF5133 domain-containing protein [Phaeacidiphilus oryzae]
MAIVDPLVLRRLVERYTAVTAGVPGPGQREDLEYTLCVYCGVRDIEAALARANEILGAPPTAAA